MRRPSLPLHMTGLILIPVAFVLLLGVTAGKAQENLSSYDRQLFTNCAPLSIAVGLSVKNTDVVLTEEAITEVVEPRLKGPRLFRSDAPQFLAVDLNVVGTAFSLRMGLNSWIADMGFGRGGTVLMWGTGATGTHGGGEYTDAAGTHGAEYILGLVARHADDFVARYLRVNEEPCTPR